MSNRPNTALRGILAIFSILLVANLVIGGWIARPLLEARGFRFGQPAATRVEPGSSTSAPDPQETAVPGTPTDTAVPISMDRGTTPAEALEKEGILLLSMRDGEHIHLFAFHPLYLPLARLTVTPWDDIHPALSPDGTKLAYSSRQNGYWDIYILDLASGEQTRVTDTPEYEASPSWSPDGLWLAYERYNGVSLDIYIQSLAESIDPIQLTDDPGVDRSPAWSPQGREIAFVSTRSGNEEIWLARLDNIDDRFYNASRSPQASDRNPAWANDGSQLVWASETSGDRRLAVWNSSEQDQMARLTAEGDRAVWSPDGKYLFSQVRDPQNSGLAAYEASSGRLTMPLMPLPGTVYGMTWVKGPLAGWLAERVHQPDTSPAPTLWAPALTRTVAPAGRAGLVDLADVTAPQPMLHDAVDEAFTALRHQVAVEAGWDMLSSLENAYMALTTPPTPTMMDDWLYTGRAFSFNTLLLNAGWVTIAREDFGGQTFWRVYLKARYQDGSMGMPLTDQTWDLNARFSGDPRAYEEGGRPGENPRGYWIDLTELATRYGWERMPSWINWRTFYPSIRFNQLVITGGLEWHQAMGELYPSEALRTPTSAPTFTPTITATEPPLPRWVTPTITPTITSIPTLRPTWTPLATQKAP